MSKELEYKIYLPKYSNADEKNARQKIKGKVLERYVKKISQRFGGASVVPKIAGCYIKEENNKLYCDENIEITTNRIFFGESEARKKTLTKGDSKFIDNITKEAAKEFGQDAVMFAVSPTDVEFADGPMNSNVKRSIVEKPNDVLSRLLQ